ncbi:MAG: preprotein translocase subunit SecE [Planctomycetaceae bacterium]|jgi:preprotein translocase subunit SecE|nr:preprotein translocase subunit SecE [Planctomycetaceae bacterium]
MYDFIKELFRLRRYKNNQGRMIRRLTMFGIWLLFAAGAYRCSLMAFAGVPVLNETGAPYVLALVIVVFGVWFGYRIVNWAKFADFLIAVEAEMVKVSWPGQTELYSSTIVVLAVFALFAAMIYIFDLVWVLLFKLTGVV